MADENLAEGPRPTGSAAAASSSAKAASTTSGFSATPAPSQAIRRSLTMDETRRRPPRVPSPVVDGLPPGVSRRRSSNFTEYSIGEARDILNPRATEGADLSSPEPSSLASASLAFALLPALAGALFTNGGAIVTDLMLLGLAGVFLHWSVTQPWAWYYSAQQVRTRHEATFESVVDEESGSDSECDESAGRSSTPLGDVPEDDSAHSAHGHAESPKSNFRQRSALRELYRYEVLALFACFIFPIASAYLLHAIRSQLSRPSEGLVSNYNLTIFMLVSELRVFSHMFKLVQARTLHLQRIVHDNPYTPSSADSHGGLSGISERVALLEARWQTEESLLQKQQETVSVGESKHTAAVSRDVRNGIQPELDALNRAVRRYEKKATVLQFQTESRFSMLEAKMDDAIALAAAAAKNSAAHKNVLIWLFEWIGGLILLPINTVLRILFLPVRSLLRLTSRKRDRPTSSKASRNVKSNSNRASAQARYSGDRVPSRLSRR